MNFRLFALFTKLAQRHGQKLLHAGNAKLAVDDLATVQAWVAGGLSP